MISENSCLLKKNDYPLISVIIPVFNGQKTIERALLSVFHQTYRNIQAIVVNDGSTDKTAILVELFAKKHGMNIDLISIQNGGLANARNVGWKIAKGAYCCNLDADDYLENDIFEYIFKTYDDFDVCFYGYRDVTENGNVIFSYETRFSYYHCMAGNDAALKKLQRKMWVCQGSAIYKKELFLNNGVENIRGINHGEDLLFITSMLYCAKKVESVEKIGVNITTSSSSMMHSHYSDSFLQSITAAEELKKRLVLWSSSQHLIRLVELEIMNQVSRVSKALICSSNFSYREKKQKIKSIRKNRFDGLARLKKDTSFKKYLELFLLKNFLPIYYLIVKTMYR